MKLPSPTLVIAALALFVGLGGGAVAATSISGKQIKNSSITGKDIKNDSLTAKDFKGSVKGAKGSRGATGPAGARGPAGPAGSGGSAGLPGSGGSGGPLTLTYRSSTVDVPAGEARNTLAECPAGQIPTGGGVGDLVPIDGGAGGFPRTGLVVVTSRPDYDVRGWIGEIQNDTTRTEELRVHVTCVAGTAVPDPE